MMPCLCLGEFTWVEPAIQSKTSVWSAVNFKKTADLGELFKLEPAIWSRDTSQWIPYLDRCQFIKIWMFNIKDLCCKLA